MNIFRKNKFRKERIKNVYAPFNGIVKSIEFIQDGFYSQKSLGDGVVAIPHAHGKKLDILAPVSGEISRSFPTAHAFEIRTKEGLTIYLQIGIGAEKLKGKGIESFAAKDEWINSGDKLATIDIAKVKAGCDFCGVLMIVTSGHEILNKNFGEITVFDEVFTVEI